MLHLSCLLVPSLMFLFCLTTAGAVLAQSDVGSVQSSSKGNIPQLHIVSRKHVHFSQCGARSSYVAFVVV